MARSLTSQLSWNVGLIQVLTFVASTLIAMGILSEPATKQVPRQMVQQVAHAIEINGPTLTLDRKKLPDSYLEDEGTAWLIARSSLGGVLVMGQVPPEFDSVSSNISRFHEMDFRSQDANLAAASVVQDRNGQRLWLLVGGIPDSGYLSLILTILHYIGLMVFLPVVVATALLIPLTIRWRMRGVRALASDASKIRLDQRGHLLDSDNVPAELHPLISSINQALLGIWDASAARDRFLGDAAHELRMPMAILRTRLNALAHGPQKLRLMSDMSRLENIAEQLLDLQRLAHRRDAYSAINLTELCSDIAAEVAPVVLDEGYEFSFQADDIPVIVSGDSGSLGRMFKNLLHNAITHGGHTGEIHFEVRADGAVSVSDSGPGIPSIERERIFSPFYRLNSSISGSGLGLHLAAEVATKHGGKIRVSESAAGGACFLVQLPILTQVVAPSSTEKGNTR